MLQDSYGRNITYLRLAVTDRCNLRCFYCMPEHGLEWLSREALLSYEEMLRLCAVAVKLGVNKIRITGGEPFVRKGLIPFLEQLSVIDGLVELSITTNGVVTAPLVPALKKLGIKSVNLSLDSLDRDRFASITHRDEFTQVMATLDALLAQSIKVKINAVVMDGKNINDLLPLVALTKHLPINVRFIEEMPFNGGDNHYAQLKWDFAKILETIQIAYPTLTKLTDPTGSTAYGYQIPGHVGDIGIIAAYTRTFCGTCNRIRITPQGILKTCLYEGGGLNLRDLLRAGGTDEDIANAIINAVKHKAIDGLEAEQKRIVAGVHESMATIGG